MSNWHLRLLPPALAAAASIAGCTETITPPPGQPAPADTHETSSLSATARQGCPVTVSTTRVAPPRSLDVSGPKPVPYVYDWYGNDALWVRLPLHGNLPAQRDPAIGALATKFPWWRVLPGALTISARRLDGPTGDFIGNPGTVGSYGRSGFDPSYLVWPAPGCWQVTGTIGDHSLTIVMRVHAYPR